MSEQVRLTVVALSLVFVLVGGYYRIQSQRSGESLDRSKEGWPLLIGIRVAGLLMLVSVVAALYRPAWFELVTVRISENAHWLGVASFGCAVAWLLWMFHTLGRNLVSAGIKGSQFSRAERVPQGVGGAGGHTTTAIAGSRRCDQHAGLFSCQSRLTDRHPSRAVNGSERIRMQLVLGVRLD